MWVLHVCESASVHNPSDDRGRAVGPASVEILRRRDVVRADNRGQLGAHHGRAVGGRCAIHGRRDDWRADSAGEQRGEYGGPAALEAAIVMLGKVKGQGDLFAPKVPAGASGWFRVALKNDGRWWSVTRDHRFPDRAIAEHWAAENGGRFAVEPRVIAEELCGTEIQWGR